MIIRLIVIVGYVNIVEKYFNPNKDKLLNLCKNCGKKIKNFIKLSTII
jgi:hypothetical protein